MSQLGPGCGCPCCAHHRSIGAPAPWMAEPAASAGEVRGRVKRARGSLSGGVFELGCWQIAARAWRSAGRAPKYGQGTGTVSQCLQGAEGLSGCTLAHATN